MKKEMTILRNGMKIQGVMYLPDKEKKQYPTIILSHGFGGNMTLNEDYATVLAGHGYAAFIYDFLGGGYDIKSDGTMNGMSVLTEAEDLNTVIDYVKELVYVDNDHLFLMGASQGGFVSAYVASQREDDIRGMVLLYPAFVLQDDARKRMEGLSEVPEKTDIMGLIVGKRYTQDALSFDIYDMIGDYHKPVLIIHGVADRIVPISYSERARRIYDDCRIKQIRDAGHGFSGKDKSRASDLMVRFVEKFV